MTIQIEVTDAEIEAIMDQFSTDDNSSYGGAWSADGEYFDVKAYTRAIIKLVEDKLNK